MSEQFKIYAEFIKDASSETQDLETYLYVKQYLKNYNLNIEISSKPLKNRFRDRYVLAGQKVKELKGPSAVPARKLTILKSYWLGRVSWPAC